MTFAALIPVTGIFGFDTGFRQQLTLKAADGDGFLALVIMCELVGMVAGRQGLHLFVAVKQGATTRSRSLEGKVKPGSILRKGYPPVTDRWSPAATDTSRSVIWSPVQSSMSMWYPYRDGLHGITGEHFNKVLPLIDSDDTRWDKWAERHPSSKILD
jgi:hypothetical protein